MPLSRHFYSMEEVQAAILYTGSRGIPEETVFWCREAVESGYVAEAIACLFESWLWHRGPFAMEWLMEAQRRLGGSEVAQEDIIEMAYRLSRCQIKDRSLWWLFVRQAEPIDRVTPRSPPLLPFNKEEQDKEEQDKEHFFLCALYQGKARSAWWAGEGIAVERWWWLMEWYVSHIIPEEERLCVQRDIEALRNYECLLGYSSSEYDRILRGVVVLRLCIRRQPHVSKESMVSSYCVRYQGRALSLPVMSLYGVCRRGRITSKETTGGELWHVMEEMKGCPYWDDVLEGEGIQDTHFPNDLPDEWSSAEKEKSHGMGLLRDGERPTLWGYTRRYMMGVARLVWQAGSMVPLQQRLEEMKWEEGVSPFVALVRGMADVPPPPSPSLRPVHKKGVIQP